MVKGADGLIYKKIEVVDPYVTLDNIFGEFDNVLKSFEAREATLFGGGLWSGGSMGFMDAAFYNDLSIYWNGIRDTNTCETCDGRIGNTYHSFDDLGGIYPGSGTACYTNCRCELEVTGGTGERFISHRQIEYKGGPGSGRKPEGGSDSGASHSDSKARAERAKQSYNPVTKEKKRIATENELKLAKSIKGKQTPDNAPFDVIRGGHAIEVKTIVAGKNDKITMHPESRNRKLESAKKNGYKMHTVVFDARNNKLYYSEGVGSYRLGGMRETNLNELGSMFS